MSKIIIAADICPTDSNEYLFENGNVHELIGQELQDIVGDADFRIYNLEGPVIEHQL